MSVDNQDDLLAWKQKIQLPYDLLSDPEHVVLETWGAWGEMNYKERTFMGTMRSYWVIDEKGVIIAGQVRISPDDSVKLALDVVAEG